MTLEQKMTELAKSFHVMHDSILGINPWDANKLDEYCASGARKPSRNSYSSRRIVDLAEAV